MPKHLSETCLFTHYSVLNGHTIICLIELVIFFLNTLANEDKKQCLPNDRIIEAKHTEHFSYNFYTGTNPFIHLLGSSLIQWMIIRINGREEPKQDLQVHHGHTIIFLIELVILFLNTLANEGKKQCLPNDRIAEAKRTEHFSYNFYTGTNPFIHLLGSSLIQ